MGIGGAPNRWLRLPIRALRCAGDFYVRSITCCARRLRCEGAGVNGCSTLCRFSDVGCGFDSTKEKNVRGDDLWEPIRASKKAKKRHGKATTMAVIDEDEACECEEDASISSNLLLSSFNKKVHTELV